MMARIIWMLCLGLIAQVAGAASLHIEADRTEIAFGQMVTVKIQADDLQVSIQQLPIQTLARDFEIFNTSYGKGSQIRKGREIMQQQLELQLFPLRVGATVIPALEAGGKQTRALPLQVLESGFGVPRVSVKTGIEGKATQRMEALLFVDVYHDGGLIFQPPNADGAGFHLRPLAQTQRQVNVAGENQVVTRFAWGAMPLRSGQARIRFTTLVASKFGVKLHYPVPTLAVNAAPVPGYLPVHVPIGALTLESRAPAQTTVGHPEQWLLKITGQGLSQEGLRKQLAQIRDTPQLRFYPQVVTLVSGGGKTELEQTFLISIPFQAKEEGVLTLPEIRIPYYDPASGLLKTASAPALGVEATDPLMDWVRRGAGGGGLLVLATWAGFLIRPRVRAWRARRSWRRQLAASKTPCELLRIWRMEKSDIQGFDAITVLERACYGPASDVDFEMLRDQVLELLNKPQLSK
ncbi:MAG: BatD family protein [Sulfuricellaceae bacterium]|nr:BatD family protein [Sulfuricellaceae bacterium]